jgi:hypothetical protein
LKSRGVIYVSFHVPEIESRKALEERNCVDLSKVETLHHALSDTMLKVSEAQNMTPQEALAGVMRMFAHLVAAYVYEEDTEIHVMRHEIETYCEDTKRMALARLHTIRVHDGDNAGLQSSDEMFPDSDPV